MTDLLRDDGSVDFRSLRMSVRRRIVEDWITLYCGMVPIARINAAMRQAFTSVDMVPPATYRAALSMWDEIQVQGKPKCR